MRKSKKRVIIKLLAAVLAAGLVLWVAGRLYLGKIGELTERMAQLKSKIDTYETAMRTVVCVATDIAAGDTLSSEKLKTVEIPADAVPADACLKVADVRGTARIDIAAGTYLTAAMLAGDRPGDDIRKTVFEGIEIPGDVGRGSCVDVRIVYPDGTDYVVLAKKDIFDADISGGSLTLQVNEEELLMMDSALADVCLFEGAGLYVTAYVERELQAAAYVNYIPSQQSIELIMNDPNVTTSILRYPAEAERGKIEGRLAENEAD